MIPRSDRGTDRLLGTKIADAGHHPGRAGISSSSGNLSQPLYRSPQQREPNPLPRRGAIAVARPIPEEAPVTIATFSGFSSFIILPAISLSLFKPDAFP
jgi:hypothetical protein